ADMAERVQGVVPRENIMFMPFELLNQDRARMVRDLEAFLEAPIDASLFDTRPLNVKKVAERRWAVQPLKEGGLKALAHELRRWATLDPRPKSVFLPERLEREVQLHFREGNEKLAKDFGYPLEELGYY
ncbi:MAG: hypothetical protein AAF692_06415, partial [Pseudomonadota bacterium]